MLIKSTESARKCGTTAAEQIIAHRGMKEQTYFRCLAKHLGVPFLERDDIGEVFFRRRDSAAALLPSFIVRAATTVSAQQIVIAPSPRLVGALEKIVINSNSKDVFALTAPSILRSVVTKELEDELTQDAIKHLIVQDPSSSAKSGADAWQGAIFVLLLLLITAFSTITPSATALGVHLMTTSFFLACVSLRLFAASTARPAKFATINRTPDKTKPTYSIMIALLDEAAVVPDLIRAMLKLQWPRAKLEIKLVCEADDSATIAALEAEDLDPRFEIIKVPVSEPRTKPKALCYALGFTTGRYVTVYDAEDRPHPEQLLEAYEALEGGGERLDCVQAPLTAANAERSFWTALFHFEYAGLFRGLLPWLARNNYPIMLGGTSNHFRRAALLAVGNWDPYNVTEDADLGLRIWRKGYQTGMITRPTLEDAPVDFKVWLPQRTRWFKGWMQTWIVQSRRPLELGATMSWPAFFVTHTFLTGTIVSAILHPLVVAKALLLTMWIITNSSENLWITWLAIFDWLTIILSYCAFAWLCWKCADTSTNRRLGAKLMLTPIYWMAISIAAWRGLFQLIRDPFYWEKTPHDAHEK